MSVSSTSITLQPARRFDGPEFFLGGGFLAGVLVFLVWLASLPDSGRSAPGARADGKGDAAALVAPGDGVLSGITGESSGGARIRDAAAAEPREDGFFSEPGATVDGEEYGPEAGTLAEDDSMAVGEDVGAPAQMEEGAALTDSLLDQPVAGPPPPIVEGRGGPLQSWYVEVEVAPGQVQMLQLNAESPEHALDILRDFRGDPRVLRGPSLDPFE